MLKRKQGSNNADWLAAAADIENLVSEAEILAAERDAVAALRSASGKIAFAWSGGKDSIVIGDLCEKAGIHDSLFVHCDLEYPAFLAWCMEHKPDSCEVINTHQDLDWLASHPNMIFPQDSRLIYRWYRIVQQAGIREFFRKHDLDMIVVGHRKADGNYTGKDGISVNQEGVRRFSVIADWPHEYVLAYIHYHQLAMPPIYGWKDGYRCGTHSWPSRAGMQTPMQGYREVYEIDPSIVIQAAERLPSARHFLEEVGA